MLNLIAVLMVVLTGQDAVAPTPTSPADPRAAAAAVGIFNQVYPHWRLRCDDPGFVRERIQFDVTLDSEGRIVSGPTMVRPQDDADWRATAESARLALIAAAPFDVPDGFPGGRYRPTFLPA